MSGAGDEPRVPRLADGRASRPPGLDLLRLPGLGRVLRWRPLRRVVQVVLLLVAAGLVAHGLLGPQLAPKNLATLVTWVHYRGLLVATLLLAGNVFCMGCPFLLPRDLARRLLPRGFRRLRRPRLLSTKWTAVGLFVAVLFVYEWQDLWATPWGTAWLIVGYFAAALLVDLLFDGAPFCKSVCPLGQFNFVASTVSPLEIAVREPDTCSGCTTHDCLVGRRDEAGAVTRRGCELGLYLPTKVGNLDCTFCLDCVHACPHDNVALRARAPAAELLDGGSRSGVGRLGQRRDLAALAVVFVFGALLNAFGMVSPVYAVQQAIADALGTTSEGVVLTVLFGAALVLEPLLLLGAAAWLTRSALGGGGSVLSVAQRYLWCLLPLGFAVWLAHYAFHLLTGLWTFVPVLQKALADAGAPLLGQPEWGLGGLRAALVTPIEYGLLTLGLVGSAGIAFGLAARERPERPLPVAAPWIGLCLLLWCTAMWLMAQPMEMRGTFLGLSS